MMPDKQDTNSILVYDTVDIRIGKMFEQCTTNSVSFNVQEWIGQYSIKSRKNFGPELLLQCLTDALVMIKRFEIVGNCLRVKLQPHSTLLIF